MLRTSRKKFFKLSLWYFLKIFEFHSKTTLAASHLTFASKFGGLKPPTLLSFLVLTLYIFLFSSSLFHVVSASAGFYLPRCSFSHLFFFGFSFDNTQFSLCLFLHLLPPLVCLAGLFVPRAFCWLAALSPHASPQRPFQSVSLPLFLPLLPKVY